MCWITFLAKSIQNCVMRKHCDKIIDLTVNAKKVVRDTLNFIQIVKLRPFDDLQIQS